MDAKRFVSGTVVGGIVLFATGYVIFNMVFAAFYRANGVSGVDREMPIMWAAFVASLSYAALIAYALGTRSGTSIGSAALTGAIAGFLLWATADFVMYGFMNVQNLTRTLVDPALECAHGGIGGAAIGAVLMGMRGSPRATAVGAGV
jgi:hypothetical protein